MSTKFVSKIACAAAAIAMAATPALAEKASDLQFINGSLGRDAERQLQERGFAHISTHKSTSGYVNSYWWDEGDDKCVTVEVYDGRVMTINDASDQDCGKHKGNDALAAVGVVAGAALIGSLFSHKSHHREGKEYNNEDTAHFERGYQDGLHNASYHNYDRSNAYSHGYEKGVDEREANLRHHHRRGGYQRAAQFKDLQGDRAAGAMEALEQRGFRQVDNFTSGNTRYSIQWQPQTRQCVQVTIADGRFYDLRDIGQHPRCR